MLFSRRVVVVSTQSERLAFWGRLEIPFSVLFGEDCLVCCSRSRLGRWGDWEDSTTDTMTTSSQSLRDMTLHGCTVIITDLGASPAQLPNAWPDPEPCARRPKTLHASRAPSIHPDSFNHGESLLARHGTMRLRPHDAADAPESAGNWTEKPGFPALEASWGPCFRALGRRISGKLFGRCPRSCFMPGTC